MNAGYSGTPLPRKLGIQPGHRVTILGAPAEFELDVAGVTLRSDLRARVPQDVLLFFTKSAAGLRRRFPALEERLETAGGLWIAWPKKSSGVATDLDFDVVQRTGLGHGLVDNKICAIDETWSGLRFVRRRRDRKKG